MGRACVIVGTVGNVQPDDRPCGRYAHQVGQRAGNGDDGRTETVWERRSRVVALGADVKVLQAALCWQEGVVQSLFVVVSAPDQAVELEGAVLEYPGCGWVVYYGREDQIFEFDHEREGL